MKLNKSTQLIREAKEFEYFTDEELLALPVGDAFVFDVECYINYFLIGFMHVATKKIVIFERGHFSDINLDKLSWMIFRFLIVGFNSANYDLPMTAKCLQGLSNEELKEISDRIIKENLKTWNLEQVLKYNTPNVNHIDLIEVCPLMGSLKLYGARLHGERLQDLPYPEDTELTPEQQIYVRNYNGNDLELTLLNLVELKDQLELRSIMSKKYNIDLRSKSDAQIAEAVIAKEIAKIKGHYVKKPKIAEGTVYKYIAPDYLCYQTPLFNEMFDIIKNADFVINENGSPQLPPELEKFIIRCAEMNYKIGIGGLHSTENSIAHVASDDEELQDHDVESYYPRIILNNGYYPQHMGKDFLIVYDNIVVTRLDAKHNKDTATANSLKIVINGMFGKLGSQYSIVFAPDLMIQVTLTGQLSLLMLIEMLELNGVPVVSANTDGIVIKPKKHLIPLAHNIIKQWEIICDFKTEQSDYLALYSRDVNNYIAVKKNKDDTIGGCKTKGAYNNPWSAEKPDIFRFHKNPVNTICIEAMNELITKGIDITETIKKCKDIKKFVVVRQVKGGATKNGVYLGKVVRWYYAKGEDSAIHYVLSGNKVATSDGARPLMDLPAELPADIDYEWYIKEAISMLYDVGYYTKPTTGLLKLG